MEGNKPLLTLVKSRFVDEATPALEPQEVGLLETLSMLCSFHTAEDMASFLYSEMFQGLIGRRPPFIVFEIGVYLDHTKTLELIASEDGVLFADGQASGAFVDNIHKATNEQDAAQQLSHWHQVVYTSTGRYD